MIQLVVYQPSIEIFGVIVQEPVTAVTDLILSLACFIAHRKIVRMGKTNEVYRFFKNFFLTMCLSTLLGGLVGHAFLYAFSFEWKVPGWIVSMISIMSIERAVIFHARPILKPIVGRVLSVINIIELVVFIILAITTLNFSFVEIHAAYGFLAVVLPLELIVYIKTKDKGSLLMFLAIFLSVLSAFIHIQKVALHTWFNHLDLSHVVLIITVFVLYKAMKAMNIIERPAR